MKAGRETLILAPKRLAQAGGGAEAGIAGDEAGVLPQKRLGNERCLGERLSTEWRGIGDRRNGGGHEGLELCGTAKLQAGRAEVAGGRRMKVADVDRQVVCRAGAVCRKGR